MAASCPQKTIRGKTARTMKVGQYFNRTNKEKGGHGKHHKIPKPVICLEDTQSLASPISSRRDGGIFPSSAVYLS